MGESATVGIERRRDYSRDIEKVQSQLETNTGFLNDKLDTTAVLLTTQINGVKSSVESLTEQLAKHMVDEETTVMDLKKDIKPIKNLVEDTEGFVKTAGRLFRFVSFFVKYVFIPVVTIAGYMASQGWVF
jgi:hypothetical protein